MIPTPAHKSPAWWTAVRGQLQGACALPFLMRIAGVRNRRWLGRMVAVWQTARSFVMAGAWVDRCKASAHAVRNGGCHV
jgi:hypothetical protein